MDYIALLTVPSPTNLDTVFPLPFLFDSCTSFIVEYFRWHIEFGNLIGLGSVRKQTPTGLKLIRTFYKPCKTRE